MEEEEKPSERVSSLSSNNIASTTKNIAAATESGKNTTSTTDSEWGSCRSEAWHCFSSNMEVLNSHLLSPIDRLTSTCWPVNVHINPSMSSVPFMSNPFLQEGVRNLHRPNDLVGSVQQVLYKVKVFL